MQFENGFQRADIALLNVFSKFDTALHEVDKWPGVLLWNKNDSLFLSITSEEELYEIYKIIKYEGSSFSYLRDRFERKKNKKQFAYIFHLSDLHFGNKLAEKRTMRIVRILEENIGKLEDSSLAIPIITGSINCERVLTFLNARGEGYAREIATFYSSSLAPIQKQLDKLEAGGVLASRTAGRTRLYTFNPRYPLLTELSALLEKSILFYDEELQQRRLLNRRRPSRSGKPL